MSLPVPAGDFEEHAFWASGHDGRLMIQQCAACRTFIHPPRPACRSCGSTDVSPQAVSGTGTVFSFTVNHQQWSRDLPVPYTIAIIALDDVPGVHVTTRLTGEGVEIPYIGAAVEVVFEQVADDIWLPLFKLQDAR